MLSSTVRLAQDEFVNLCKFGTQVSPREVEFLGHHSSRKVAPKKSLDKLVERSKARVWVDAKDALLAPSCTLKDSLVIGSANVAAQTAEGLVHAEESYQTLTWDQNFLASADGPFSSADRCRVKRASLTNSAIKRQGLAMMASNHVKMCPSL